MDHPSVEEILASASTGPGDVADHVAACSACQQIAALGASLDEPETTVDPASLPLDVPIVDPSVYVRGEEISDGRGGMGRTFRAIDRRLGRAVALKEMLPAPRSIDAAARERQRRRFEREARLTARLEHPAIVGVHEAGRWPDGEPFYAMRLVPGTPLDEAIEARRTLAARLALIPNVTVIAEAVAYAHAQGIIHRDIKPANILLGQFGETVLIDWGLAKDLREAGGEAPEDAALAARDGLTQMGYGTPQYMPPEQARGEEPDERVDIYALGATLYHVLAGHPPYGRAADVRARLRDGPPPPIRAIAPGAPAELFAIVDKAMARDPSARFQQAIELAEELRRFQNGQLTRTHRYTAGEILRHWARRHRAVLQIAAVALAALAVGGVLSAKRIVEERRRAEENERRAQRELARALGQTASQLAPRPERRLEAAISGARAVGMALRDGEPPDGEAVQGLVDALTAGPLLVPLIGHRGTVRDFASSPDGATLFTAGSDRTMRLWDARSGRPLRALHAGIPVVDFVRPSPRGDRLVVWGIDEDAELWSPLADMTVRLRGPELVAGAAFTPDGRRVVTADTRTFRVWDAATGRPAGSFALEQNASKLAASVDGRVAVGLADGTVVLWNARDEARSLLRRHGAEVRQLAFSPDGARLVTADADGLYLQWNLAVDPPRATELLRDPALPATLTPTLADVMAPDGRHAVFHTQRGAQVFDLDHPGSRRVLDTGIGFTFSSDSRNLYSLMLDGRLRAWDVESGRELLHLAGPPDGGEAIRWIEGPVIGQRVAVASSDGPAYLWDARVGRATGMLLGHTGEITSAETSHRSGLLLTASDDGTARMWDLDAGAPRVVMAAGVELASARFSPDEARVVTAGIDGLARVFDVSGKPLAVLGRPGAPLSAALFSPDGRRVLTASLDGTALLWDGASGAALIQMDAAIEDPSAGAVTATAISPDGARVVLGYADGSARLWDASSGEIVATLPSDDPSEGSGVASVFFTPDGARVLVGLVAGASLLCDARDLGPLLRLEGRSASATRPPFSRDGSLAITVLADGGVLVGDLVRGEVAALEGHTKLVLSAALSADERRLVTASIDGTIRVWDVARGETVLTFGSIGQGAATWAQLSPDGRWVVAAYESGALRIHPATAESALGRACDTLDYFGRAEDVAEACHALGAKHATSTQRRQ